MSHFWRKKAVLLKIESVYGTDPTPTGMANAILIVNAKLSVAAGEVSRNLDQPFMGAQGSLYTGVHYEFSGEFEMQGSGDHDEAPAWGPLMRALKHAEVVDTDGHKVTYSPISTALESATIYFNIDGRRFKLVGFRGKLTGKIGMGDVPRFGFTGKGLFLAWTDTALPTVDTSAFLEPLVVNKANTPTFTVNGVALKLKSLDFDNGGKVEMRELVGQEEIVVTDHEMMGNFDVERPLIATIDLQALCKARTSVPIQVIHGTVAGKIVQIDWDAAQLGFPESTESQGIVHDQVKFRALPTDGNDDYLITVK